LPVDFILMADGTRVDLPAPRPVAQRLAAAYQAREEEDLREAPMPVELGEA
jgi:hypothetical protein